MSDAQDHEAPGEPIGEAASAVRARQDRFAQLRAAWRALAPSILATEEGEAEASVRALREQLRALAARGTGAEDGELSALDAELERYAQSLRVSLDHVPVAQLRSTLPEVEASQRGEVLALLDLVLEDEAHLRKRIAVADYLVTLLSTQEKGGRRRIMHDPVGLTGRLQAFTERLAAGMKQDLEGAEQGFFVAVRRLEEGDMEGVLRDVRRLKNELGLSLFLPEVLRALVFYNASFWNRIRSQIEVDRAAEENADADLPVELAAATEEEDAPAFDTEPGRDGGSVFASKGLRAVAQALARWTLGEELGRAPAERVAMRLDLASLSPEEHAALSAATGGASPDAATDALVLTVVVGLVLRSLPIVESELRNLRIDPALLTRDWLRELDQALEQAVAGALTGSAATRTISGVRSRYLYAPLAELDREAPAAQPPAAAPATAAPAAAAETAPSRPAPKHPAKAQPLRHGPRQIPLAAQIAALALVVAVGVAIFTWKIRTPSSVHVFSKSELQLVSAQLDSGYRDQHGTGALFVGTVNPKWKALAPAERDAKARELVKRLSESGVRQVMLFDHDHRLEVQYSAGQPVQVLR